MTKQGDAAPLGLGLGQAFGSLIVPCEDEDDVDEAAAALLAMSCPDAHAQAKVYSASNPLLTSPPCWSCHGARSYGFASRRKWLW